MIYFSYPTQTGNEIQHIKKALDGRLLSGDNAYMNKCHNWFEKKTGCLKAFFTSSCTHALELSALLLDIKQGDEVIMPSYTFSSTANAFVLRGAKIVFIDINKYTLNLDETKIEGAITKKTKAIVAVHYAGVSCEMKTILKIAQQYNLYVIEDAAQGMMASYNNKPLGSLGDIGTYSFHETKNYQCGEGGLILVNNKKFLKRAEIIREKGTNRSQFFRGETDKYSWVDIGSSYLPSELNASCLYAQLEQAEIINQNRLELWDSYWHNLIPLSNNGLIELPFIPKYSHHNGHIFYIKVKNLAERMQLLNYLNNNGVWATFHYVPLHSSKAGKKFGYFHGEDIYTTKESERLIRLPIYYQMKLEDLNKVCERIYKFYKS